MNLAVMQPYLFPYIGYFQLIYASDLFLVFDDAAYKKRSFINRNTVLSANGPTRVTLPVLDASQNKPISDLVFSNDTGKFLKTLEHGYSKAPYFGAAFPLVKEIIEQEDRSIASVCLNSYQAICSYLGLERAFEKTSELEYSRDLAGQERLIALARKLGAERYINLPGGRALYTKSEFSANGVELKFIDPHPAPYDQGREEFTPNLSIIDLLMNCPPHMVIDRIRQFELN